MLKVITGLTGTYCMSNAALLHCNKYWVKRGNLITSKGMCQMVPAGIVVGLYFTPLQKITYWLDYFISDDKSSYEVLNYQTEFFGKICYANIDGCIIEGYRARGIGGVGGDGPISYWNSYADKADRYDIKAFSSPDELQKFVNDNMLAFNRDSYGLINIVNEQNNAFITSSSDNRITTTSSSGNGMSSVIRHDRIYIIHNDKQYTIITTLSEDEFYEHLAKTYQLPLTKLILLIFIALVGYQCFYSHNKE